MYGGLNIDYKGEDVTPHNFINVLRGNSTGITGGNGKVLKRSVSLHLLITVVVFAR